MMEAEAASLLQDRLKYAAVRLSHSQRERGPNP